MLLENDSIVDPVEAMAGRYEVPPGRTMAPELRDKWLQFYLLILQKADED
jgi:hypothetical protein